MHFGCMIPGALWYSDSPMTQAGRCTRAQGNPSVCALVLNWNGKEHLEYSLPSLLATDYSPWELVLVDNASTDGSAEYAGSFSGITLIRNDRNLQYAAGNNVGIRYALRKNVQYVAILNNDVRVDPRWLTVGVRTAEENPKIACVGYRVFNEYRQDDPDGRRFEEAVDQWHTPNVTPSAHISGCALLLRTEALRRVGFFDERYVAYGEEDDLERRIVRAGYEMVRVDVPVWHYSMGSWSRMPLRASWLAMRNGIRCAIKNDGAGAVWRHLLATARSARVSSSRVDPKYYLRRRLSPSHGIVNLSLLAGAVLWNLLFLPQTLSARRESRERGISRRAAEEEVE